MSSFNFFSLCSICFFTHIILSFQNRKDSVILESVGSIVMVIQEHQRTKNRLNYVFKKENHYFNARI